MIGDQSLYRLEGYKVLREITEGSFGEISEVVQISTHKTFALKALLKCHLIKTDTLKEARLEGLLLELLDHPGIIKLHDIREDEDYLYLIMQLGGRGDLKDLLSNKTTKGQWRPETKIMLAQILDTIGYLHGLGIVHCDIKPQNIVIMGKGNPKLVDFGTARIFDRELLSSDILDRWDSFVFQEKTSGSPEYISPEGIKGEASPARDIWAFGVLAYWLFHGKLPFLGSNHLQIFSKIRDSEPHVDETLNQEAKSLILSCLSKNPEQRPTFSQLKHYEYFSDIDFKCIFDQKPKPKQKVLFQSDIQKKMFFGNYKKRVLKVTIESQGLILSYCYPDTGLIKKRIKLEPSDFAEIGEQNEFFVRTRTEKLFFKSESQQESKECVNLINQALKGFYEL